MSESCQKDTLANPLFGTKDFRRLSEFGLIPLHYYMFITWAN